MKQRAQHIAVVLASAPILYGIDFLVGKLSPGSEPLEPFYKVIWEMCWEPLSPP